VRARCSLSLLQIVCYSRCCNTRREGYGRDLTEDFPKLAGIFERFGKRESAKVEGGRPEEMLKKFWVWAEGPY
jgi:hypothetical protein